MPVDAAVRAFGPFLIPVVLFVVGAIGYAAFVLLTRRGIISGHSHGSGERDTRPDGADDGDESLPDGSDRGRNR